MWSGIAVWMREVIIEEAGFGRRERVNVLNVVLSNFTVKSLGDLVKVEIDSVDLGGAGESEFLTISLIQTDSKSNLKVIIWLLVIIFVSTFPLTSQKGTHLWSVSFYVFPCPKIYLMQVSPPPPAFAGTSRSFVFKTDPCLSFIPHQKAVESCLLSPFSALSAVTRVSIPLTWLVHLPLAPNLLHKFSYFLWPFLCPGSHSSPWSIGHFTFEPNFSISETKRSE